MFECQPRTSTCGSSPPLYAISTLDRCCMLICRPIPKEIIPQELEGWTSVSWGVPFCILDQLAAFCLPLHRLTSYLVVTVSFLASLSTFFEGPCEADLGSLRIYAKWWGAKQVIYITKTQCYASIQRNGVLKTPRVVGVEDRSQRLIGQYYTNRRFSWFTDRWFGYYEHEFHTLRTKKVSGCQSVLDLLKKIQT